MKYFDHDVESYKDDKIMLLRHAHGSEAIDAYWAIVEQIYRDEEAFSDSQPIASESLTKPSEAQAKPSETPIEEEGEEDIGEKEKSTKKEKPDGKARAAFVAACLEVFNRETNSQIAYVDAETQVRIWRIFDTGRTIDDVRLVTRDKFAEWKDDPKMGKFIRPKTFFGDQFESYLATARRKDAQRAEREGRYAKYA